MDDTTPPVTKIYLVSLIYTPKKRTNAPTFTSSRKGEENPWAVRRGIIPSRKPLLRHTCMDLYHTTSDTRMKQEIAQRYSKRLDLAQTNVAILPSGRADRKACRQGARAPRLDHCTWWAQSAVCCVSPAGLLGQRPRAPVRLRSGVLVRPCSGVFGGQPAVAPAVGEVDHQSYRHPDKKPQPGAGGQEAHKQEAR